MNKYGDILLPFVTPFDDKEEVNYDVFAKLIEFAIEKNWCDSIIATGTTGEFNALTFDERVKLYETAFRVSKGRKPVIAGTGCASTRETVALTKAAISIGIDTCLVVAPYYCKPTQDAVYEHYMRIADETDAKLILYNIPIFTGINTEPKLIQRLAQHKNIIGIKDESGMNPIQITDYYLVTKDVRPDFLIYNGDDIMLMPTLAQGAMGIVSGGSLAAGHLVRQVFSRYRQGDPAGALEAFRSIVAMTEAYSYKDRVNPIPALRVAVEAVSGLPIGAPRGPLNKLNDEERTHLLSVLRDLRIIA